MASINANKQVIIALIFFIVGASACKSNKQVVDNKAKVDVVAEDAAKVTLAKNELRKLLTDNSLSVTDLEAELAKIKAQGLNNAEVTDLINQVQQLIDQKKAAEAQVQNRSLAGNQTAVLNTFSQISQAGSYDAANGVIDKMLDEFESPNTPVLIIIAEEQGEKDYDKPTTIEKYLEYIKVQKRFESTVEEIVRNKDGKISRLVLRKK